MRREYGDRRPFDPLRGTLVPFTPDFELMPGTKAVKAHAPDKPKDPLKVPERDTQGIP